MCKGTSVKLNNEVVGMDTPDDFTLMAEDDKQPSDLNSGDKGPSESVSNTPESKAKSNSVASCASSISYVHIHAEARKAAYM